MLLHAVMDVDVSQLIGAGLHEHTLGPDAPPTATATGPAAGTLAPARSTSGIP